MNRKIRENIETNKTIRIIELLFLFVLLIASMFSFAFGLIKVNKDYSKVDYLGQIELYRDASEEDYSEDNRICDVLYKNDNDQLIISYNYDEYLNLNNEQITAYKYKVDDISILFDHENPSTNEIIKEYKEILYDNSSFEFNLGISLFILALALSIILFFSNFFTTYEKIWFISFMIIATIVSCLYPEESANGVNGVIIMLLYLLDTFFNILCELLISKQSRYNFLVSVLVEITEIIMCLVLMYRFATLATTLLFWLPIDIISFINWSKHKDEEKEELTVVRKLKGYQEILIIIGIVLWTVIVGYFVSGLDIVTDFLPNRTIEKIIIYLDAFASAAGICNGLFILFRLREQWLAWYICAILESIINILSGQYVLLVLKFAYLTNTTYGYIKWNKYIKERE